MNRAGVAPGREENVQLVVLAGHSASSQEELWLSPPEGIAVAQGRIG